MAEKCSGAVIKLDSHEAPYPPSQRVIAVLEKYMEELNRYKWSEVEDLAARIADVNGIEPGMVVVTRDRRSALETVLRSLIREKKQLTIGVPSPGLLELRGLVEPYAVEIIELQLNPRNDHWEAPLELFTEKLGSLDLLVLDNPNDPTGSLLIDDLEKAHVLLEEACHRGVTVLVDESFYEYSGFSLLELVEHYPCLVVMRSFEHAYALAGLGPGYLVAPVDMATKLRIDAAPVTGIVAAAAKAALSDQKYYLSMVERLVTERERLRQLLLGLPGVHAYRSHAGFLLVKTSSARIVDKLCSQGVSVAETPLGDNYVRVSIGSQGDNNSFLAALVKIIKEEARLA